MIKVKDTSTFEEAATLFAAKDYEGFAAHTAKAITRYNRSCWPASVLDHSVEPIVPKVGSVFSASPTKVAVYKEGDILKPLQICTRPAFEIDKPLDEDRYTDLLHATCQSLDMMFYNLVDSTASVVVASDVPGMSQHVDSFFGDDNKFWVTMGSELGQDPEFLQYARSFAYQEYDDSEPEYRILPGDTALFFKERFISGYGSLFLSDTTNSVVEGFDLDQFPAIGLEPSLKSDDGEDSEPMMAFSFVSRMQMCIDDSQALLLGTLVKSVSDVQPQDL